MELDKLEKTTFTFEYGEGNFKNLILTSDKKLYEKLKAQNNIGVLFEPEVVAENLSIEIPAIYLVGILRDK